MNGVERLGDVVEARAVDLADETQRQMKLVGLVPARAVNAAAKPGQTITDGGRKIDGDEEAVHGEISPGS